MKTSVLGLAPLALLSMFACSAGEGADSERPVSAVEAVISDEGSWLDANSGSGIDSSVSVTLLNGAVLVAGGENETPVNTARLYHPAANTWSAVAPMPVACFWASAVRLQDGRVLVAGGHATETTANDAGIRYTQIYDPVANHWSLGGDLPWGAVLGGMVLLQDGDVLLTGADASDGAVVDESKAAVYHVATNTWVEVGPTVFKRRQPMVTVLDDGRVLSAGGEYYDYGAGNSDPFYPFASTTEIYDPIANTWSTGPSMTVPRFKGAYGRLPNGNVIFAGGASQNAATSSVDVFDPATNTITPAASVAQPRSEAVGATLSNGSFLVAGGRSQTPYGAEIYDPRHDAWSSAGLTASGFASLPTGNVIPHYGFLVGAFGDAELYRFDLGSTCSADGDCAVSGHCSDGVCSDAACADDACCACTVAHGSTSDGHCVFFDGVSCGDNDSCTSSACASGVCVSSTLECAGGLDADGQSVDGTTCGESVCGGDRQEYSCTPTGWEITSATCGGCTCFDGEDEQGDAIDPLTTTCSTEVCGIDSSIWSCTASGWQATATPCGHACTCYNAIDEDGNAVDPATTTCSTEVCGEDFHTWSCTVDGWTTNDDVCGHGCTCYGGVDSDGNAIDPATTSCEMAPVCGEDLNLYACTITGWEATGGSCQ